MKPVEIQGKTRWAGVMGWPVSHSLSPVIQNCWCARYGVDAVYLPLPVQPEKLPEVIRALGHMGCAGVNLTIPHKEQVLPYLNQLDAQAKRIGAVNTVVIREQVLYGHNTDAYGFWQNLITEAPQVKRDAAFVVGAGGAARAVVAALDEAGYSTIHVMNRTPGKVERLKQVSRKVKEVAWRSAPAELAQADLLVNTTNLGMQGQPPLELALGKLPKHALVTDIVYTPLETPLLKQAKMLDLATVDGIGMLIYQAQKAFELWFGILPEVDGSLRGELLERLKRR